MNVISDIKNDDFVNILAFYLYNHHIMIKLDHQ